ncbi:MAG TPA: NnrU family protein [Candidimonas sp.]|nr:NnrU family protein [Candidimonas sp.]
MTLFILGLVIFLGTHSVRIVADDWRTEQRARHGERTWKLAYSLVSAVGLVLIIWGYGMARQDPTPIWAPPVATRHIASLLTLISFVLLAAAYVPRNGLKAALHHPMVLGVALWAVAHLLANGTLADIVLFASFLVWSLWSYAAARKRDRLENTLYPAGTPKGTAISVVVGILAWTIFALWLHVPLIGVYPFA